LRQDYPEFQCRNAEIIAIGTSKPGAFQKQWAKHGIPFPALPDPNKEALDPLGQEFKLWKFGRMPGILVIDIDGYVRFAHYGNSAGDIPDNQEILTFLDGINSERHVIGSGL
jgi:peroxiredoxin